MGFIQNLIMLWLKSDGEKAYKEMQSNPAINAQRRRMEEANEAFREAVKNNDADYAREKANGEHD